VKEGRKEGRNEGRKEGKGRWSHALNTIVMPTYGMEIYLQV